MMPFEAVSPHQRVQRTATPRRWAHVLPLLALALASFSSVASAQAAPVQRSLAPADVPEAIRPPGEVLQAVAFRDRRGENVVAITKVQWALGAAPGQSPDTRALIHVRHGSGRSLGALTLRSSDGRQHSCRGAELAVQVEALETTDVDGDGLAEIVLVIDANCPGYRQWRHRMAFEDGTDLLAAEQTMCGGDAELDAGLRGSGLERGVERRWRAILWDRARFDRTPSPSGERARARAQSARAQSAGATTPVPGSDGASDILRWRDRSGEHAVVVHETRSEDGATARWSLEAAHYRLESGAWRRVDTHQAAASCTEGDFLAGYHPHRTHLSDWDRDGTKELSFFHTAGCMTDYSSAGATMMILEGDRTYRVQGFTWAGNPEEPEECGGFDPTLRFADEPIHALVRRLQRRR